MPEFLFVYGTLRSEFENPYARRLRAEADRECVSSVSGSIYHLGSYPGFLFEPQGTVTGELYRLHSPEQTLSALDAYEGSEYSRRQVISSTGHAAWIYVYQGHVDESSRIASGDFLNP
jgi:gamma-glutamylcyclotransferase (GGCT)/AIG2-like uncharacterized protein YtfP